MAFNPSPSAWLENWSEDGTDITVPIATFPELTAAEADATTGDIRKLLFALLEKLWAKWSATSAADRPSKLAISRTSTINNDTGVITRTYTFTVQTAAASQEVIAET